MRLLVIFLLCGGATLSAQSFGALPEDTTAYFDFWVGSWEVTWQEGGGQVGRGTNHITKDLDGKVIEENFRILEGKSQGFQGRSLSIFHRPTRTWRQSWVDNQGGYYAFEGHVDGQKRIFRTAVRDLANGKRLVQRMVFYDFRPDGGFTWDWEASLDGGKSWQLNWRIDYAPLE